MPPEAAPPALCTLREELENVGGAAALPPYPDQRKRFALYGGAAFFAALLAGYLYEKAQQP